MYVYVYTGYHCSYQPGKNFVARSPPLPFIFDVLSTFICSMRFSINDKYAGSALPAGALLITVRAKGRRSKWDSAN